MLQAEWQVRQTGGETEARRAPGQPWEVTRYTSRLERPEDGSPVKYLGVRSVRSVRRGHEVNVSTTHISLLAVSQARMSSTMRPPRVRGTCILVLRS